MMIPFEASKYHAYARECLRQAETADKVETRDKLMELSRVWLEAALNEERYRIGSAGEPHLAAKPVAA
jgi:hypothetical protein